MSIVYVPRVRTTKPTEYVKLGDWRRLFSIKPRELYLHQMDGNTVYETVTGRFIAHSGGSGSNGNIVPSPFGRALDTNVQVRWTSYIDYSAGVTFLTFCRYNSDAQDHQLFSGQSQDPMMIAQNNGGNLRPYMWAGTNQYGSEDVLTSDVPGYRGEPGWHCWGGKMASNSTESKFAVNGTISAGVNPGAFTNTTGLTVYYNSATVSRLMDANVIWTMSFEGLLPDAELAYITANPEAIYSILEDELVPIWIGATPAVNFSIQPIITELVANRVIIGRAGVYIPPELPPTVTDVIPFSFPTTYRFRQL